MQSPQIKYKNFGRTFKKNQDQHIIMIGTIFGIWKQYQNIFGDNQSSKATFRCARIYITL